MSVHQKVNTKSANRSATTKLRIQVLALLLGMIVATVGTFTHRQWVPFVLIAALALLAVAGVFIRASFGSESLFGYGVGVICTLLYFSLAGPGGDIVMPADGLSMVWLIAGSAMIAVPAFSPNKWFKNQK